MFPLGSVLFPTMVLPLHVFEERYRQLVSDCLDEGTEPEFGVVLIERGSEVGGGDVRAMTGTVARIVEAARFPDGRWALGCVGTRRIRVSEWLDDDPYPRAEIEPWDDPDPAGDLTSQVRDVTQRVRQALALRAELGEPSGPATVEISEDPVLAGYQLAAIGPFGPSDRQALLELPDADSRLARLGALVEEELAFLQLRLTMDGDEA